MADVTSPKNIVIVSVVDVLEALAKDTTEGSVYLMDNNVRNGSTQEGTPILNTKVQVGDRLMWTVMPLEVDSYVGIANVTVGGGICEPKEYRYPDSDVKYWYAEVEKEPTEPFEYSISYWLGSRPQSMAPIRKPFLVS